MERIKTFSEIDTDSLDREVYTWLKANPHIVIVDRQFSTCVVGDINERIVYYNYLIAYKE